MRVNMAKVAPGLKDVIDMHAAGNLTDEEFAAAKAAVLGLPRAGNDAYKNETKAEDKNETKEEEEPKPSQEAKVL